MVLLSPLPGTQVPFKKMIFIYKQSEHLPKSFKIFYFIFKDYNILWSSMTYARKHDLQKIHLAWFSVHCALLTLKSNDLTLYIPLLPFAKQCSEHYSSWEQESNKLAVASSNQNEQLLCKVYSSCGFACHKSLWIIKT